MGVDVTVPYAPSNQTIAHDAFSSYLDPSTLLETPSYFVHESTARATTSDLWQDENFAQIDVTEVVDTDGMAPSHSGVPPASRGPDQASESPSYRNLRSLSPTWGPFGDDQPEKTATQTGDVNMDDSVTAT
jgi:hypothetical protein